ncbi:MAG: type II toxin-antitoxin system VapC family toxin [Actinobacteria bacterium]|nr:type II toxin-antitoxin system VapC family toxin [Actinomycetota bacterium]
MALFYLDSSALVKLVREEPETAALSAYLSNADLITSSIVLTEVPRAVRRAAVAEKPRRLAQLIAQADAVIDALALVPVDDAMLIVAGALEAPGLRSLDAIHIAAASSVSPISAFVSYDERQSAAARLTGLRTTSPGANE